ncbi:MAG: CopG family antitoxin [Dehalococcoidia bacterium]
MKNPSSAANDAFETEEDLVEINSWDEMPSFASEQEEADWWETHSLGPGILDALGAQDFDNLLPPPRPRTSPISIRFDADTLARLKLLARRKHKGYQTLAKEFISERLYEEEKREGIIGDSKAS